MRAIWSSALLPACVSSGLPGRARIGKPSTWRATRPGSRCRSHPSSYLVRLFFEGPGTSRAAVPRAATCRNAGLLCCAQAGCWRPMPAVFVRWSERSSASHRCGNDFLCGQAKRYPKKDRKWPFGQPDRQDAAGLVQIREQSPDRSGINRGHRARPLRWRRTNRRRGRQCGAPNKVAAERVACQISCRPLDGCNGASKIRCLAYLRCSWNHNHAQADDSCCRVQACLPHGSNSKRPEQVTDLD